MEKVVADASIIVSGSLMKSIQIMQGIGVHKCSIEIAAPELMPYEVLNALKYTGMFTEEELTMAARSLSLYGFRLYSLSGKLAEKTVEVAVQNDVTVYDASYVALAEDLNSKLYTADEKLIERVDKDFVLHISELR